MAIASRRENMSPLVHRLPLESGWCVWTCASEHVSVSWYILSCRLHLSCSAGGLLSSLCGLDGWAPAWMSRVSPGCYRTSSPTYVSLRSSTRTFSRTSLCSHSFKILRLHFFGCYLNSARSVKAGRDGFILIGTRMLTYIDRALAALAATFPLCQLVKEGKSIFLLLSSCALSSTSSHTRQDLDYSNDAKQQHCRFDLIKQNYSHCF